MSGDKTRVKIIVEGLPNTGKVAMSHLIVRLFQEHGLTARRMKNEFDLAEDVIGFDEPTLKRIMGQLLEREVEIEVLEKQLPYTPAGGSNEH